MYWEYFAHTTGALLGTLHRGLRASEEAPSTERVFPLGREA